MYIDSLLWCDHKLNESCITKWMQSLEQIADVAARNEFHMVSPYFCSAVLTAQYLNSNSKIQI